MPRRILLLSFLLLSLTVFAQTSEHFITVDGTQRRYLLHLPPGYDPAKPTPLIFMLHGGGGSPEHTGTRDLAEFADAKGFIVVYPEGLTKGWNDGRNIPGRAQPDDVAFFSAMIDELVRTQHADPKRIYATGMSNGGFMSFRLACDLADKITAIAPVAGSMGEGSFATCKPKRPVPVLMINGTADPLVHFEGGPVARRNGRSEPIQKVVDFWRNVDHCQDMESTTKLEDRDPNDDSTVTKTWCTSADQKNEVINYTVTGGGHTWPGGPQYFPKALVGPVNRDFNASEVIVDFFSRHGGAEAGPTSAGIERVYCAGGEAHIVDAGHETVPPRLKDQTDCTDPVIATDHQSAGWLAEFDDCCTSYPIPLRLVLYRGGKTQPLDCELMIWKWAFSDDDKKVVLAAGPTHGANDPSVYCRFEVATGKLLDKVWNPPPGKSGLPAWTAAVNQRP